jgi:prephenate dehydrogenase
VAVDVTVAPSVGIVGLGLIGGSLARALVAAGARVVATTRNPTTREGAAALGVEILDDLGAVAASGVEVVVAATALAQLPTTVAELGAAVGAEGPIVTDVGSVKAPIAALASEMADPAGLVPGHPMAGTEESGWDAGSADMFAGRTWALGVDAPAALDRWATVAAMALAVGSPVVPVSATEHDDVVALVSHLPYALAALTASAVDLEPHPALARSLAAGSFDSLTRVAGGHPTLGAEMASGNRTALAARTRELVTALELVAEALEAGDDEEVSAVFDRGLRARALLGPPSGDRRTTTLDRAGLLDLGRAGGRVVAVRSAGADAVEVDVITPAAGTP